MKRGKTFSQIKTDALQRPDARAGNWKQTAAWGVLLGWTVALLVLLALAHHPLGAKLQYDTLDFWFGLRDPLLPRAVAVLEVDEATLQRWGGRSFDARQISRLLRELKRHRVRAAALAFPDLAHAPLSPRDEAILARGLRDSGIAHLPLHFRDPSQSGNGAGRRASRTLTSLTDFAVASPQQAAIAPGDAAAAYRNLRLARPGSALLDGAKGAGFLNFPLEHDGRVRELPLMLPHAGHLYPALPLSALLGAWQLDSPTQRQRLRLTDEAGHSVPFREAEYLNAGAFRIPAWRGTLLLNFPAGAALDAPRPGDARTDPSAASPSAFHTISVAAALDDPRRLSVLAGKSVVIGPTAPGWTSLYQGPGARRIPAVEVYAVALDNLLTGRVLRRVPDSWIWLLTIFPCGLIGGFVTARRPSWSGLVTFTSLFAIALLSLGLFSRNVWLDITAPWIGGGLTYLIGVMGRARRQERDNTRVTSTIEAISQVSEVIAAQTQTHELLSRVLDWAMDLLNSTSGAALLLDEETQTLRFVTATGPKGPEVLPFTLKVGEGIAGWVAQHGEAAIVNDAQHDTRFKRDIDREVDFQTQSILCVPLRVRDKILGVLEVLNRADGHPFSLADAELLMAVASQCAVVLENAQLYEILNLRVERSESALESTNRRLESERNLLSTVLQSMTGGIIVTDAHEEVQLVNPAALRLLPEMAGWRELKGDARQISTLIPDFFLQSPDSSAPPGTPFQIPQATLKRGDPDAPRLIEAQGAPLFGASDETLGWVVVLDDVTEARHIDRAKSDFVSFVAHEMRSPLTSIAGFASMLQRNDSMGNAASRARFLGLIKGESERLTRLINSLLDVARIEAGRPIELLRDEADIQEIAQAACESQQAYSSRHSIVCAVPPGLPKVVADRDKTLQILINLISNGLKYSPGGTVTVSARRAGEFLEISVRDEGPGIPPEQRRVLFERFGRATTAPVSGAGAQAKPTGTGLGLFLTKHLVETHGGTIRASNGANGGAVFTFTLPVAEKPHEDKPETNENAA